MGVVRVEEAGETGLVGGDAQSLVDPLDVEDEAEECAVGRSRQSRVGERTIAGCVWGAAVHDPPFGEDAEDGGESERRVEEGMMGRQEVCG